MKVKKEEVKEYIEFRKDLKEFDINEVMKDWNGQDSILEADPYYSDKQFDIYKIGINKYLNNELSYEELYTWFMLSRGAIAQSFLHPSNKNNTTNYMQLFLLYTEAIKEKDKKIDNNCLKEIIKYIDSLNKQRK